MEPRTLVLTPYMYANRIASWQQAICLVVTDKCDVLESYEASVSSPSLTLQVPAVVRLRKEISAWKSGVKFSRLNVLQRDGFRCCYCGHKKSHRELNYDHVLPRAQGGRTVWENIVSSCKRCNGRKGSRTPQQAGMRMHFQPHKPRALPMTAPLVIDADKMPDIWRPYLEATAQTA